MDSLSRIDYTFTKNHKTLLDIYSKFFHGHQIDTAARALSKARTVIAEDKCQKSLISYELYLEKMALRSFPKQKVLELTLLKDSELSLQLSKDPSNPLTLIAISLLNLRNGNHKKCRHMLRRVATSKFDESVMAKKLLSSIVTRSERI